LEGKVGLAFELNIKQIQATIKIPLRLVFVAFFLKYPYITMKVRSAQHEL
jgi:hypothetical protein